MLRMIRRACEAVDSRRAVSSCWMMWCRLEGSVWSRTLGLSARASHAGSHHVTQRQTSPAELNLQQDLGVDFLAQRAAGNLPAHEGRDVMQ